MSTNNTNQTNIALTVPSLSEALELKQKMYESLMLDIEKKEKELAALKASYSETKYDKDFTLRYRDGSVNCKNMRHFSYVKDTRPGAHPNAKRFVRKDARVIYNMMTSYVPAACQCEFSAVNEIADRGQAPGTYQSEWAVHGSGQKGYGSAPKPGSLPKKVMSLRYTLTQAQVEYLHSRFPSWLFVYDSILRHDHPVAHTTTQLATRCVFHEKITSTPEKRSVIIDVNGNPAANASNMKHTHHDITTICSIHTPRDTHRRVTKWGELCDDEGNARWYNVSADQAHTVAAVKEKMLVADYITMIHCMYYYTPQSLLSILSQCRDTTKIIAVLHRHKGSHGTFNNKEQEWKKVGDGAESRQTIIQKNVLTGVTYEHPSTEWLFTKNSWDNGVDGLAWDVNMVCEDTFLVTMTKYKVTDVLPTRAPVGHDYRSGSKRLNVEVNSMEYLREYGRAYIAPPGSKAFEIEVNSDYLDVLNDLRKYMIGKPRTAEVWKSFCSVAKTKFKKFDRDTKAVVDYEDLEAVLKAAFWMDVERDLSFDTEMFNDHYTTSLKSKKLYELGGLAGERLVLHHAIGAFLRSNVGPSPVNALLEAAQVIFTSKM